MATVTQVIRVQPAPGKLGQCLEIAGQLRKLRERAGAKERLYRTGTGTLVIVVETAGWKQFGEMAAKLENDAEAQKVFSRLDTDPVGTILSVEIVEEIER